MRAGPRSLALKYAARPRQGTGRACGFLPLPPTATAIVRAQPARDYVVWSLFSTFYMNFCFLGFAALVFSIKSRDCKVIGDPEGASKYGRRAKYLNLAALAMGILFIIIFITVFAVSASLILQHLHDLTGDFHGPNVEPLKVK
ncbi:hypothetical protein JRQ81_000225 [Phrynocephalus forsythii]|uniref:Uncharacterized protein n=1 Tax=Phrynocephalus forsythii TaxID=171643 RepID=A0A9Q0Y4Y0_9SAUR|nr:hypothetical protein JRQ81_000225 [Phrynocephalus forsythii]